MTDKQKNIYMLQLRTIFDKPMDNREKYNMIDDLVYKSNERIMVIELLCSMWAHEILSYSVFMKQIISTTKNGSKYPLLYYVNWPTKMSNYTRTPNDAIATAKLLYDLGHSPLTTFGSETLLTSLRLAFYNDGISPDVEQALYNTYVYPSEVVINNCALYVTSKITSDMNSIRTLLVWLFTINMKIVVDTIIMQCSNIYVEESKQFIPYVRIMMNNIKKCIKLGHSVPHAKPYDEHAIDFEPFFIAHPWHSDKMLEQFNTMMHTAILSSNCVLQGAIIGELYYKNNKNIIDIYIDECLNDVDKNMNNLILCVIHSEYAPDKLHSIESNAEIQNAIKTTLSIKKPNPKFIHSLKLCV